MLSLRGPEFEERDGKLPPIRQEEDHLFQRYSKLIVMHQMNIKVLSIRQDYRDRDEYMRAESRMSVTSPERYVWPLHKS